MTQSLLNTVFLDEDQFEDPMLKLLAQEINGCYRNQWFDACAILCRRITESLIVRTFCAAGHEEQIFHAKNGWSSLGTLTGLTRSRKYIQVSPDTLAFLSQVKKLGNKAAHHPFDRVEKAEIDSLRASLSETIRELL